MVGYVILLVIFAACVGFARKLFLSRRKQNAVPKAMNAIGKGARVYKKISRNGIGIVSVALDGKLVEFEARSHDGTAIASFTPVQVVTAIDDRTVTVAPVNFSPNT
ncbi:MAG: hypothetical protein WC222_03910 [Parachlamydiales bacterium]|jgi:hypothetical protein